MLKILELFGGIGACSKALERLGIDYERAARVNSNTQLYKQAGNSIVVNVLEAILKNLLLETNQDVITGQMSIYDYINVSNSK